MKIIIIIINTSTLSERGLESDSVALCLACGSKARGTSDVREIIGKSMRKLNVEPGAGTLKILPFLDELHFTGLTRRAYRYLFISDNCLEVFRIIGILKLYSRLMNNIFYEI